MTIETVSAVAEVAKPTAVNAEPSMAEYAAMRHAEMRGEKPETQPKAAAIEPEVKVEATEETTAAETKTDDEGKMTSESANEEDTSETIEEAHPAKKGIQKRFSEMTAKQKAIQAEADQYKLEVEEARAEVDRLKAEAVKAAEVIIPVVPKVEDDPTPNRNDFDDPDEYVAALSAHTTRSEIRKSNEAAHAQVEAKRQEAEQAQQEEQQARVQTQIAELHKNFNERVEKAAADYPDYSEKVTNNEKLTLRNDVFFAIEQAELAPHILYHLANNPDEAASLNAMQPNSAMIRLGELQAEIRIARKPKATKAAEPIKPVGNRASPDRKTPDEESMAEYAARREQELKQESAQRRANR